MEITKAPLLNTKLRDRTLWFDGDSVFSADNLAAIIDKYNVRYVDKLTPSVREYNMHVRPDQEISVKHECNPLSVRWNIPSSFAAIDIVEYVFEKHDIVVAHFSPSEITARERRLMSEVLEMDARGLLDVVRALIYVINTLTANQVVWGVGRGSSVSSYLMYVIGVHDVDAFMYDLPIDEFLHD